MPGRPQGFPGITIFSGRSRGLRSRAMHPPRPPAFDHGVVSFLWALFLGLFIWVGQLAVGVAQVTALVVAVVSAFGIFLFVRIYGDDVGA